MLEAERTRCLESGAWGGADTEGAARVTSAIEPPRVECEGKRRENRIEVASCHTQSSDV